ncbi:hypothetical protein [Acetobacter vaccinii]|uniref:Uncharacterized protein n=1 Tax=Acetobacter vaccinii TaxID=2592655 RepID=A0A5C1YNR8_9PROT|nr:hypothetical protein [Acetobacter vaccinii]QEO17611.1 hypothetical protein FLP30_07635 [Acetobacter vaccinii]
MAVFSTFTGRATILAGLMLPFAVGCSTMEPLDQSYHWRPLGVYDANIAAMAERKSDLVSGRPLGPSDGHQAAEAVQRWRDGKVRKLPNTGLAEVKSSGGDDQGESGSGSGLAAATGAGG